MYIILRQTEHAEYGTLLCYCFSGLTEKMTIPIRRLIQREIVIDRDQVVATVREQHSKADDLILVVRYHQ